MAGRTLTALLLTSCSVPAEREKIRIMNEIEWSVQLPKDAVRPADYSRYFAWRPDGKVAVLYVVHGTHLAEMREWCRENPVGEFPCSREGEVELVGPGRRRWLDDSRELPSISGGGCADVEFTYDPATKSMTPPACNGPY